jgi:hypothetical protein
MDKGANTSVHSTAVHPAQVWNYTHQEKDKGNCKETIALENKYTLELAIFMCEECNRASIAYMYCK